MPTFISLMKTTEQGAKNMADGSRRLDEISDCISKAGGK